MKAEIKDIYGTEIVISESRSGYFRLDLKGESFPSERDSVTGKDIPTCIALNENSAKILQSYLNIYFEEE